MAIFDEKKAEICIRLERNGHFGLKKGQKLTDASTEMAISWASRAYRALVILVILSGEVEVIIIV